MTAAARALGVVHNPAPRLNLPVKDDAKFVSDRIRARLYRDPRIDPTAKFVAVTIAEWAGDRNMKAWPAQLTLSRMTGYTVDTVCRAIHRLVGLRRGRQDEVPTWPDGGALRVSILAD